MVAETREARKKFFLHYVTPSTEERSRGTLGYVYIASLVPRPFFSLKKKSAEKSGGRVWANGLLLGVARAGMQP